MKIKIKTVRANIAAQAFAGLLLVGSTRGWEGDKSVAGLKQDAASEYFQAPVTFEVNQGQAEHSVKFMARGLGYTLFLSPDNAVLSFFGSAPGEDDLAPNRAACVALKLVGANREPKVSGKDELVAKSSYFLGNDPKKWRTNIPNFGEVHYENIYPGIDLEYHGIQGRLEYDFIVAPGAKPQAIAVEIKGAKRIAVSPEGELVLKAARGEVRFHKPYAYQSDGEKRQFVAARYHLKCRNRVGFVIGAYDSKRPLIIDPVLSIGNPDSPLHAVTRD